MFVTVYTERELRNERVKNRYTNSGEKTRPNYKPVYNADGVYELVPDGVINSYDDIQSHADSCDLSLIIERYNMTGDSSLLNQRHGFYEDVTNMPATYAEMQNALIKANNDFLALPLEIREKFGQDPARFYAEYGSPRWMEIMGISSQSSSEPATDAAVSDATDNGGEE